MNMEKELAAYLCEELRRGLPPEQESLVTIRAVLGDLPPGELAARLADSEDPEAQPMRELLLFPDAAMARGVERWLLERQTAPEPLDGEQLARDLEGAQVVVALGDGARLEAWLEPGEARQLVSRLHPGSPAPAAVREAVEQACGELGVAAAQDDMALDVLARCRRARLDWTPGKEQFMARLVRGLARGVPGRAGHSGDRPGFSRRLLEAVNWCVPFLQHAGDDVASELALKRTELEERLEQAQREEKNRDRYNFETRRMMGMASSFVEPGLVREELALVDDIARATGGLPMAPQVRTVHRDLEDVGSVETVEDMQRLLGLLGGE